MTIEDKQRIDRILSPGLLVALRTVVRLAGKILHRDHTTTRKSSFFGPTNPATLLEPIDGYSEEVHYRPPICLPCLHVTQIPPCRDCNVCMQLFTLDHVPLTPWCEDSSGKSLLPAEID